MSLDESSVIENFPGPSAEEPTEEKTGEVAETGGGEAFFCPENTQALTVTHNRAAGNVVRRKRCITRTVVRVKGSNGAQIASPEKFQDRCRTPRTAAAAPNRFARLNLPATRPKIIENGWRRGQGARRRETLASLNPGPAVFSVWRNRCNQLFLNYLLIYDAFYFQPWGWQDFPAAGFRDCRFKPPPGRAEARRRGACDP